MKLPTPSKTTLTLRNTLKEAAQKLLSAKIESAWLDAELILAFVLKKTRSQILSHDEIILSKIQFKKFNLLIKQRLNFVPIAYILGYKEFYGLKFKVTKDTLVPRPESELMVEEALKYIDTKTFVIDIGTGSGCLLSSVLKHCKAKGLAIDISKKALAVARLNAKSHKLSKRIIFKQNNLLSNIKVPKSNLVILANLPYLNGKEMKEKTISKEPKTALYAGADGLLYYKKLEQQLKHYSNYTLLCEINPGQKNGFRKLFPKAEFKKDLSGKIRLAIVTNVIPAKAGTQGRIKTN